MQTIGKYQIIKEIGSGTSSTVYLAIDPFNQQRVAIKLFDAKVLKGNSRAKAFRNLLATEAALAGKLSHPHIVKIFDAVMSGDLNYVVMEYVEGETLEKYADVDRLLPLGRITEIVYKCCKALLYAQQQGVIHRDIKPANILLRGESDIKISDFGAAVIDNPQITQVNGVGSPAYMSPEQIREQPLSHQTDIYSLGVTMYRLLTGRLPFDAKSHYGMLYQILNIEPALPSTYRPEIPWMLDGIVLRAMHKDTAQRYQTWNEMAQDLVTFFNRYVSSEEKTYDIEKFDIIRSLSFFREFSDVELWEVLSISKWGKVYQGEQILREGDEGLNFFVVAQGTVRVVKQGWLLGFLNAGDCFGEMAYFSSKNNRRCADVFAESDVTLIEFDPRMLTEVSSDCRYRFSQSFLRILIKRLALADARIAITKRDTEK